MTSTDDNSADFRAHASAASEVLLRSQRSYLSRNKSGISYCLVQQSGLSQFRALIKVSIVACIVLALSGIAGSGIIGFMTLFLREQRLANNLSLLALAAGCMVGGILSLFLPVFVERSIVRLKLPRRQEDSDPGHAPNGIHVALENAVTHDAMKFLAEDVGLIYIFPEARYVRIDGLSYEYRIQAQDVVELALHWKGKGVLLSYMIGTERLDLLIVPRSVMAEFERQAVGSSPGLLVKMKQALQPGRGVASESIQS
jgi:hypothetical protein